MQSKIDDNFERRFFKNRALAAAGARFFIICGSKLGINIDRTSIKKRSSRWNAPWHRLSFDFGRFRDASLCGKTIKKPMSKNIKNLMFLGRSRVRPGRKGVYPPPSSGNTLRNIPPSSCVSSSCVGSHPIFAILDG